MLLPVFLQPSVMFAGTDIAVRLICDIKPYISVFAKSAVSL